MDTEIRCFIELEEQDATKEAQPRVQAGNGKEIWPGLFGQETALDKWIRCRLSSRCADFQRHVGGP
jgi:hypothetical protein